MASITLHRTVHAPFSGVIDYARQFFTEHPRLGIYTATVNVETSTHDDPTDRTRRHDALAVAWVSSSKWPLPNLAAALTVRPEAPGSRIYFVGTYVPPLGAFGRLFDFVVGRFIARKTFSDLLTQLIAEIERRHEAFLEALPDT